MKSKEDALHLVVIDDSSNDAETVSNMLRNAGHAVRATRVEDAEDLRKTLTAQPCDMVLAKLEIPFFSAAEAVAVIREMKLEVPLVIIEESGKHPGALACLKAGARDTVSLSDPERLEHVVLREVGDLNVRRRLAECELALAQANERAQELVDTSRDAIAYVHEGMHIYANESYVQMFGYQDVAEIEGMPLLSMVSPDDHGKFKEFLRRMGRDHQGTGSLQVRAFKADATEFQVTMEFSPTTYEGEHCIQVIIRDQTLSRELEQRLHDLSRQDLLTGLYNRQYFLDVLQQTVVDGRQHGAVLYLEPDQFRALREELGIAASDLLLADLAALLKDELSDDSLVLARFDSYAFTVLAPDIEDERAAALAAHIVKAVEGHVADAGGRTVSITCSVGASLFNESVTDAQEVLRRAEKARRTAMEAGGNRVEVYNPAAEEMAEKERALLWTKKLKIALRDNAFYLVFQPIVSLHGDPNENYEVYLRMTDDGKEVDPTEFIPVAEQTGLMAAVDRWVLHNAVKVLAERWRSGKRTNLFVNLSEASLKDAKLLPWIRELLKAARLEGNCLVVEVAENVAQANLRLLKPFFDGLKQLHVRTALDHFGAAPNATNLLRHIRTDFLKLEGSLVSSVARDVQQQRRLKDLTNAAKEAKCQTVAEFVEDANTLAVLWGSGIDYIQGYFLQRPIRELNYDFSGEASL
ncbi:MAG: EAL domain-containing protein [Thiohalomonadaceae bacterium]